MQNSDFRTRNTSPYGSQPSFVPFRCKRATLGPELQVSLGPRPHLWYFTFKTATLQCTVVLCMQNSVISTRNSSLYGSQPSSVVFACKRATFWSELQVSMGPRPHLGFFAFKTATLQPSLYGSQSSSGFLWIHNSDIMTRINSLSGSQTSTVV